MYQYFRLSKEANVMFAFIQVSISDAYLLRKRKPEMSNINVNAGTLGFAREDLHGAA